MVHHPLLESRAASLRDDVPTLLRHRKQLGTSVGCLRGLRRIRQVDREWKTVARGGYRLSYDHLL